MRAKRGGEIGKNGEHYRGGTFLPSTTAPKGERPRYTAGSGKALIAPGVLEVVPEGKRAIFAGVAAVVVRAADGTIAPLPADHPVWASDVYGTRAEVAADCAAWNAGERFKI